MGVVSSFLNSSYLKVRLPTYSGSLIHYSVHPLLFSCFSSENAKVLENTSQTMLTSYMLSSQRDVTMFLRRTRLSLVLQHLQTTTDQRPSFPWEDDLVNISEFCSNVRIREFLAILLEELLALFLLVLRSLNLFAKDDVDGSIRTHHCALRREPDVDEV